MLRQRGLIRMKIFRRVGFRLSPSAIHLDNHAEKDYNYSIVEGYQ